MQFHQSTVASIREAIVRVLARYQVDGVALYEEAGLDLSATVPGDTMLHIDQTIAFWDSAVAATRNPAIGFEVGAAVVPTNLHVLGYAWLASLTLKRALMRLQRFHTVFRAAFDVQLVETGSELELQVLFHEQAPQPMRDGVMSMIVALCRAITDEDFAPLRVQTAAAPPEPIDVVQQFYRCPLVTQGDTNSVFFSRQTSEEPLPRGNPVMARVSDQLVQDYIAETNRQDVGGRTRAYVTQHLPEGEPTRAQVAEHLALSERTLTRRLAAQGTSFRALVDEVRSFLAITYMHEADRSIIEIAFLLGFRDASNFARAFKRWNGVSPSEYRSTIGVDQTTG